MLCNINHFLFHLFIGNTEYILQSSSEKQLLLRMDSIRLLANLISYLNKSREGIIQLLFLQNPLNLRTLSPITKAPVVSLPTHRYLIVVRLRHLSMVVFNCVGTKRVRVFVLIPANTVFTSERIAAEHGVTIKLSCSAKGFFKSKLLKVRVELCQ